MLWALVLTAQETLTGTAVFTGKTPPSTRVMAPSAKEFDHSSIRVNKESRALADLLVEVRTLDDKPARSAIAEGSATMTITDEDFEPRVLVMGVGQKLKIVNGTGMIHNAHGLATANAEFNVALPDGKTHDALFEAKVPERFRVRCDICSWQQATIVVTSNGAAAVTGTDGAFKIDGLAAGTYLVKFWHPKIAEITVPVKVPGSLFLALNAEGLDVEHLIERALKREAPKRDDPRLEGLVRDLGSDDPAAREAATEELAASDAANLVGPLLKSGDLEVRARARRILTRIGMR